NFLHDLLTRDESERVVSVQKLEEYQKHILNRYDTNNDGRLEIKELVGLLPLQENFLARFEGLEGLTASDFDDIFDHYDQDKSGSIEGAELEGLMKDCLARQKVEANYAELKENVKSILEAIDINRDGKLQKDELKMLFSKNK
ncbi:putative calbindin-32-like isoform X6, partial [Apostichopus japonicus]